MPTKLQSAAQVLTAFEQRRHKCDQKNTPDEQQQRLSFGICSIDELLDGGLVQAGLHEVRCSTARDMGAALGFVLGLLAMLRDEDASRILWVTDPATCLDTGTLFPAGLQQYGIAPSNLTMVKARDLMSAMWAVDEAAKCPDLKAVVFQVKGNPVRFDMTATRRLAFRASNSGTPVLILRQSGAEEATAATTRWHVNVHTSRTDRNFEKGMGTMRQSLTLERNRNGRTGNWLIAWNHQKRVFEDAAAPSTHIVHRLYPSANRQDSPAKMGQVMAG